jgi:aconitate hydratase
VDSLGLTGDETIEIDGLAALIAGGLSQSRDMKVRARRRRTARRWSSRAVVRIDTPQEVLYYRHGGILQYVLRQLLTGRDDSESTPSTVAAKHDVAADARPDSGDVEEGSIESFPASDPPAH